MRIVMMKMMVVMAMVVMMAMLMMIMTMMVMMMSVACHPTILPSLIPPPVPSHPGHPSPQYLPWCPHFATKREHHQISALKSCKGPSAQ
jgi:hypothetical protein